MSVQLPALPARADVLDVRQVERIERDVSMKLARVDDLDVLDEWRAQAAALAEYLRGRELQGPMLGAQRRVEARIGQLLDTDEAVGGRGRKRQHADGLHRQFVAEFLTLAQALDDGLVTDDEWRRSRRALVVLIRERVPAPSRGSVEPRAIRARLALRKEFTARLQQLSADARWLERRVAKTVDVASASDVDRWETRLADTLARLANVSDALTKGAA